MTEETKSENVENVAENVTPEVENSTESVNQEATVDTERDKECLSKASYMLVNLKMDPNVVRESLLKQKFSEEQVDRVFNNPELMTAAISAMSDAQKEEESKEGTGTIVKGVICIVAGLGITLLSYTMASGGGKFKLMWGLVVYGIYMVIKGIIQKAKN